MQTGYQFVSIRNLKRIILTAELSVTKEVCLAMDSFSKEVANELDSKLLYSNITRFPSDIKELSNCTYLAVLSTSHIAISTYISKKEKYIDIEVAWCSSTDISKNYFIKLTRKYFNIKKYRYLKLNHKGEILDEDGLLD
ncbi:MAG TPA: hypothetical protein EYH09_00615 [Candidatus Nanopusillus sp.]|nr:hypothetical protein [Candidatus Nanopusillus sp.]HIP89990.1 hypothetical protein [Candidatus Nanopusillus sp.]